MGCVVFEGSSIPLHRPSSAFNSAFCAPQAERKEMLVERAVALPRLHVLRPHPHLCNEMLRLHLPKPKRISGWSRLALPVLPFAEETLVGASTPFAFHNRSTGHFVGVKWISQFPLRTLACDASVRCVPRRLLHTTPSAK